MPTGQSTTLICTKEDGKGTCAMAAAADGKEIVVVGEELKKGDPMKCVNMATVINGTSSQAVSLFPSRAARSPQQPERVSL